MNPYRIAAHVPKPTPLTLPRSIKSALFLFITLGCSIGTAGCGTLLSSLPAVAVDLANIAKIVITDIEAHDTPAQIIADVLKQTGAADETTLISVITSLLADAKVPAADVAELNSLLTSAQASLAARKLAASKP